MSSVEPALVERVRRRLADAEEPPTAARVAAVLRSEAGVRGDADLLEVLRALQSELAGAGPLEPLLADPAVTDVLVNGPDEVWVDRGTGLERAAIHFADDEAVRRLAVRLAGTTGRRLDLARPFVDARLPDGSRLHAVLPPISPRGTCLSLRVLRNRSFTLSDLVAARPFRPIWPRCWRRPSPRASRSSCRAGPVPARPRCSASCSASLTRPSAWCSSRTPASFPSTARTSSGWRPDRPTWRALVRSSCATWSGRPCGCARTGSWDRG